MTTQSKEEKEKMLYNVGLGIAYLHKRGFSHNDFHGENIVVENGIISIIDLEYSSIENVGVRLENKSDNSSCSTFHKNCVIEYNPEAYRNFWSDLDPDLKMSNDYDPYVNDISKLALGLKNNEEKLALIKGYLQVKFDIGFINTVRKYFSPSIVESMNQYIMNMKNKLREMYISHYLESIFSKGVFATFDHNPLTQIVVPDTVRTIGNSAFRNLSSLRETYLPPRLVEIGDYAFFQCNNLKKINLPPALTSIGEFAFSGCSKLEQIEIPETVTNIGNSAFSLCPKLSRVSTAPNITAIGNGPVWERIYISSNVNVIDREFFMNCNFNRSNKIIIPDTVTTIADSAFRCFSDLREIYLPPSVTKIGDYAFWECINLKKINLPPALTSIGKFAFSSCLELEQIEIPDTVTNIGHSAFSFCYKLSRASIPANITAISGGLFLGCSGLTQINIPTNVTIIEKCAFVNCFSLKEMNIPSNVTEIKDFAFMGCRNLRNVIMGSNEIIIAAQAFRFCPFDYNKPMVIQGNDKNLLAKLMESDETVISLNAFKFCPLTESKLKREIKKSVEIYTKALYNYSL